MADELIPPDVRDFIQRHIDSIAQLEALLLAPGNGDSYSPTAGGGARFPLQPVSVSSVADGGNQSPE
jgi:hypothetical protein